ncbi:MAG: hypothetical protein DI538_15625 [Azospira oryzae]|jgi:hypothetical protein|nr:MAG: hypothetical protein DI538_15625 [Azospira oryzae]
MSHLHAHAKAQMLKCLLEENVITIREDLMDAQQIMYDKIKQIIVMEHWCPRENSTYSLKELTIDEAWDYALKYAPESLTNAALQWSDSMD